MNCGGMHEANEATCIATNVDMTTRDDTSLCRVGKQMATLRSTAMKTMFHADTSEDAQYKSWVCQRRQTAQSTVRTPVDHIVGCRNIAVATMHR